MRILEVRVRKNELSGFDCFCFDPCFLRNGRQQPHAHPFAQGGYRIERPRAGFAEYRNRFTQIHKGEYEPIDLAFGFFAHPPILEQFVDGREVFMPQDSFSFRQRSKVPS